MNKNTSSIARKLNWSWTLKRFFDYLFWDVIIVALLYYGWIYVSEKYHLISWDVIEEAAYLTYFGFLVLGLHIFDVLF